ncbi:MAG: DNA methylase, partial [Deltaproteobacteria bacterium]
DGMYFTQGQAAEYETKKAELKGFEQLTFIVSNESEGIEWLRARLTENPMTYQDIQPDWMKAVVAVRKGDILPELRDILSENFIKEDGSKWRVPDMNEQKDRDTMRTKSLLRDFETYKTKIQKPKGRLKEVRVEALRAGFKHCWDAKDYATMVAVAERIPKKILEEDEFLLMYYDIAKDKVV